MKKTAILGITVICLYAAAVILFLIFRTELFLTVWEIVTIASAPVMLVILLSIMKYSSQIKPLCLYLTLVFMACTIVLTSAAHFVNIAVTRRLLAEGIMIPTYFQIGYWPSLEMAIDYLAWGFFMGLAFIATAYSFTAESSYFRSLRALLLICGTLCLSGFFGTVLINENLWYLAPLGYVAGAVMVCVHLLRRQDNTHPDSFKGSVA